MILLCLTPDDFTHQRETPWLIALKFVGVLLKHLNLLQKSLEIFGNFLKCFAMFVWPSENFWRILGNLQKVAKNIVMYYENFMQ